jgi:hypothetical protein
MKIDRMRQQVKFTGEDGCSLEIGYTNMGEPYREGIQLCLDDGGHERSPYIFLEQHEAKELRDLLNRLYPEK